MAFPVEEVMPEIRRALAANRDVVLTAPPGSGKTTCVPPALLDAPWLAGKKIVMLEPRRLAARNCAQYISHKLGEPVGDTVGYQVRLERKVSANTRLEIVTEGLLVQRILGDPELADVGLVIFDEFHERALPCDLAFALALEVRRALRPDLRLLVMSATLDADEVAVHLGDADVVRADGRMFPVRTEYLGDVSMTAAIAKARETTDGDILCFLPGEGEIRNVECRMRNDEWRNCEILPLYGSLPKDEQDRVFADSPRRKVILATSIAETSVTIPGVTCVIDSGLMRVPRFSPASGMTGLVTLPLTRDRAEQRRGRAGRVRPGVCYRLWTAEGDASRPAKMMPEILDADLASLVLASAAWGALRREDLPWMTPPPASAWTQAVQLLKLLGALDATGRLTAKGERMAKLPMHPRLANMVMGGGVEKFERCEGFGNTSAMLAAIIEEGSKSRETDIRRILDEVRETPNRPYSKRILQLARRFSNAQTSKHPNAQTFSEGSLLALAYPDRVAKGRGNGSFRMVSGRGAFFDPNDPLAKAPFVVCCELDDRAGDAKVFLGCPIAEDEVEALFADKIVEEPYCEWDRPTERVKAVVRRKLGAMTLKEKVISNKEEGRSVEDSSFVDAMLDGVRQKGVTNLPCWTKEALQLRARIAFMAKHDASWPQPTDDAILAALTGFLSGMTKWRDLEKLDLFRVFDVLLSNPSHAPSVPVPHDRRELDRLAPTRMEVPSGSHVLIHYEGDEPTAEVKLQECFGLMDTPKLAGGRVPVVMTLLSPAQRPIQVTKDLAGFWKGAYQLVRKDMRGRYPKHYWPEDPFTAVATRRTCRCMRALFAVAACCAGVLFGGTTTVTFYGGAGQVGGSSAVVQNGETKVLVDCGTTYGDEEVRSVGSEGGAFGFDPTALSALVLTHAHQDHAGRVPQLVRAGFKGEIWMTPATLAILRIVWRSQISYETEVRREWVWTMRDGGGKRFHWRKDCEWAGKVSKKNRRSFTGTHDELEAHMKKVRGGKTHIFPCRTCQDLEVDEIVRQVRTIPFEACVTLTPFKVVFRPVKHLPGAAAIYFDDGEARFAFSGDLGTTRSRFVERIAPADPVDTVFVETTYGDESRGGRNETEAEYRRFRETIGRVVGAGGIAWIPAFALDRSQRVLAEVACGIDEGLIGADVPIHYLSPSSRAMTEEYLRHPEWFDNGLPAMIAPLFQRSRKWFNAKRQTGAAILLTTSGMMDMGLSYSLVPDLVPRSDVTVCLVGYQSPSACGGRLKRGDKTLNVVAAGRSAEVPVRCKVEAFWCFSGHGDARENDDWLANNLKSKIYLVHGDADGLETRRNALATRYGASAEVVRAGVPYVMTHRSDAVAAEGSRGAQH